MSSPAKSPKKKAASKKTPSHPTYQQMIKMAIGNLKERNGSSKAAILKYIVTHYKVGDNIKQINAHLRLAINRGVKSGSLKQVKGNGASGSFRLADKAVKPKKAKATKKSASKKSPTKAKKPASPKKAKTSPKKKSSPKKTSSPKKAKTAPAKKSPKKATSPKKPKAPAKKSPAKKQASPKKKTSPKKKVAKK